MNRQLISIFLITPFVTDETVAFRPLIIGIEHRGWHNSIARAAIRWHTFCGFTFLDVSTWITIRLFGECNDLISRRGRKRRRRNVSRYTRHTRSLHVLAAARHANVKDDALSCELYKSRLRESRINCITFARRVETIVETAIKNANEGPKVRFIRTSERGRGQFPGKYSSRVPSQFTYFPTF